MQKYICKFCSKELASSSSLNNHITKAQYCIKNRKILGNILVFNCDSCNKKYTSKQSLEIHSIKCVDKKISTIVNKYESSIKILELQIDSQNKHIEKLEDKLENIAIKAVQRPTTTNNMNKTQINNFIQKMEPLSREYLVDKAPNLTLEHVQKGASGYAEYALEYPLKDRVACVDYSRRKIKFKDIEGNVITDPEMMKLAPMFFDSIKDKSSQLVHSQNTPDMDSAMFEDVAKLFNTNADVKNGSTGVKTDFYHDFVKHVCSGSMVE
jgi:hypothetical protein